MRLCAILLLMQSIAAAYACPDVPQLAGSSVAVVAPMPSGVDADCAVDTMAASRVSTLCHEHYASARSVDQAPLAFLAPSPAGVAPSFMVAAIQPAAVHAPPVLPALLARPTSPRITIRFQVFRI